MATFEGDNGHIENCYVGKTLSDLSDFRVSALLSIIINFAQIVMSCVVTSLVQTRLLFLTFNLDRSTVSVCRRFINELAANYTAGPD